MQRGENLKIYSRIHRFNVVVYKIRDNLLRIVNDPLYTKLY